MISAPSVWRCQLYEEISKCTREPNLWIILLNRPYLMGILPFVNYSRYLRRVTAASKGCSILIGPFHLAIATFNEPNPFAVFDVGNF